MSRSILGDTAGSRRVNGACLSVRHKLLLLASVQGSDQDSVRFLSGKCSLALPVYFQLQLIFYVLVHPFYRKPHYEGRFTTGTLEYS